MLRNSLISMSFLALSQPVFAQDNKDQTQDDDTEWTVGISGGGTIVENANDQQFASLSIIRDFGDSYLGVSASYIDSGSVQGLVDAIPASTTEFTASAGTSFDAFNIDGYISYGKRDFDIESLSRNGNMVTIDADGDSFGVGLSASYDFLAGEQTFITPILSVDYNKLDIVRVVMLPNGDQAAISNSEDGITGTLGIALQQLFGDDDRHLLSLIATGVTTSNTTAFNPGNGQYPVLRALAAREEPGQKDSWAELGGSVSIGVGNNTRLDLSIIRTIGFLDSDATSLSAGLRHSF